MKVRNDSSDEILIRVSFRLKIGELIDSNIMQLLPLEFGKNISKIVNG